MPFSTPARPLKLWDISPAVDEQSAVFPGGTGGVSYLRKMLDVVLFPEIWKLRTSL